MDHIKPNKIVYLAGAMESVGDQGLNWRLEYRDRLNELGIKSIIPNLEESKLVDEKPKEIAKLKKTNIKKYIKIMHQFIEFDLKIVEDVDMLIVKWDGEATAGTVHEVGYAYQLKKPCYLITSKKLHEVPGWFLACFTEVFPSLDELINFLNWNKLQKIIIEKNGERKEYIVKNIGYSLFNDFIDVTGVPIKEQKLSEILWQEDCNLYSTCNQYNETKVMCHFKNKYVEFCSKHPLFEFECDMPVRITIEKLKGNENE